MGKKKEIWERRKRYGKEERDIRKSERERESERERDRRKRKSERERERERDRERGGKKKVIGEIERA